MVELLGRIDWGGARSCGIKDWLVFSGCDLNSGYDEGRAHRTRFRGVAELAVLSSEITAGLLLLLSDR